MNKLYVFQQLFFLFLGFIMYRVTRSTSLHSHVMCIWKTTSINGGWDKFSLPIESKFDCVTLYTQSWNICVHYIFIKNFRIFYSSNPLAWRTDEISPKTFPKGNLNLKFPQLGNTNVSFLNFTWFFFTKIFIFTLELLTCFAWRIN